MVKRKEVTLMKKIKDHSVHFVKQGNDLTYRPENKPYTILCLFTLIAGLTIHWLFKETNLLIYIPFVALLGVCIQRIGTIFLIISLFNVAIFAPFTQFSFFEFVLNFFSFLITSSLMWFIVRRFHRDQEELMSLVSALSQSLDARDPYTAFHSENVAYYSYEIAKAMKYSKKDCLNIYLGGLLHDVGKIGIPESVLNKPSRLTNEEFEQMKKHPEIGYQILKKIPYIRNNGILDMVLYHHEKFDGGGYPRGLKEEEIPIFARIMCVADSFDAMTSQRVYRKKIDVDYAIQELKRGRGTQFDPQVVNVFLQLLEEGKVEIKGKSK